MAGLSRTNRTGPILGELDQPATVHLGHNAGSLRAVGRRVDPGLTGLALTVGAPDVDVRSGSAFRPLRSSRRAEEVRASCDRDAGGVLRRNRRSQLDGRARTGSPKRRSTTWRGVTTDADGRVAGCRCRSNELTGRFQRSSRTWRISGFCGSRTTGSPALSRPVWGAWPNSRNCRYGKPLPRRKRGDEGLTGAIPAELGNLTSLERLSLSGPRPDRADSGCLGQPDQPPGAASLRKQLDRDGPGRVGEPDQPPLAEPRRQPVDRAASGRPGAAHPPQTGWISTTTTGRRGRSRTRGAACPTSPDCG